MKVTNFRVVVSAADDSTPTPSVTPTSDSTIVPDSDADVVVPSTSDTAAQSAGDVAVPNTGHLAGAGEMAMRGGFDTGLIVLITFVFVVLACLTTFLVRCKKKSKINFGAMSRKAPVGIYASMGIVAVMAVIGIGRVISLVSDEVKATEFDAFSVDEAIEIRVQLDKDESITVCSGGRVVLNEALSNGYNIKMQASNLSLESDSSVKIPSISTTGSLQGNTWGYRMKGDNKVSPIPIASAASIKDIETATQSGDITNVDYCVMLDSDVEAGTYESSISYTVEPHADSSSVDDPDPVDPDPVDPDPVDPDPVDPDPVATQSDVPIEPVNAASDDIPCDPRTIDLGVVDNAYYYGEQYSVRLCSIPNIVDRDGSSDGYNDEYIHVNSRVSGAFYAMAEEHKNRCGVDLIASEGFRTMAEQQYFWDLYQSGQGNVAAQPGYSNHQAGLAVDFDTYTFCTVDSSVVSGGWFNESFLAGFGLRDGRSFGENWHIEAIGN